jgi:hypothetical protein
VLTVSFELTPWFTSFLVFIFFGLAEEAEKQYIAAILALLKRLGINLRRASHPPSPHSNRKSLQRRRSHLLPSTCFPCLMHIINILISSSKFSLLYRISADSAAAVSTPRTLHSSLDTSSIATLSLFEPPERTFDKHDPSAYVLDVIAIRGT